jgi:hypothetical protein
MSISSAKQLWRVLHERECTLIAELATSVGVPLLDKFNYSRRSSYYYEETVKLLFVLLSEM